MTPMRRCPRSIRCCVATRPPSRSSIPIQCTPGSRVLEHDDGNMCRQQRLQERAGVAVGGDHDAVHLLGAQHEAQSAAHAPGRGRCCTAARAALPRCRRAPARARSRHRRGWPSLGSPALRSSSAAGAGCVRPRLDNSQESAIASSTLHPRFVGHVAGAVVDDIRYRCHRHPRPRRYIFMRNSLLS